MTLEDVLNKYPALKTVEKSEENGWRTLKSYVLRGQRLKDNQIEALEKHYSEYVVEYCNKKIDFKELFGNDNPVVIEIGFGMGDSTARIAANNPNINYLGIEVFLYGFSKLLSNIANRHLNNIKIMRFNAVDVLNDMIPDSSVEGFHIFFPDPWPKKRHNKRRLVTRPFTNLLSAKLEQGGYIYCVTDWEDYAAWMLEELGNTEGLTNPYNGFCEPRPWRPQTSFERKGLDKDYKINEVWFEKI